MRSPGSTTPYPLQQGQISFISFFDPMISILIWGFVRCSFAFSSQWFLRVKCHSQCNCLKRIKLGCRACFCTSSRLIILSVISQCSISFLYPLPRVIILFCHSHFAGWEVSERFASWAQDGVCRNSKRASSISTHCLSGRKETQKNCHDSRTSWALQRPLRILLMGVSSPKHVASGIFHEFEGFKHPKRCKTCICAVSLTLPSTPHVFVDFGVLIPPNTKHKHDMIYGDQSCCARWSPRRFFQHQVGAKPPPFSG